jgi:hypothetical protein
MKLSSLNKLFVICLVSIVFSCNKPPCQCDFVPAQFIEIKFVDQQGQNLVFGTGAKYRLDTLRILNEKNNFNINNASVRRGIGDSTAVRLDFYTPAVKNFIYYNSQTPQDSLIIKWLVKTGKCCGHAEEYMIADSVKFNNDLITPINNVYYFVK